MVLAIIGILISVAIIGINGAQIASRNSIRAQAISAINVDIQSYFSSHHYYPSDIWFSNKANFTGSSYSSCQSQNGNFTDTSRICLGIYPPTYSTTGRFWVVYDTSLSKPPLISYSGFDGYTQSEGVSNYNGATTPSTTQFFYVDLVYDQNNYQYPQGYILGFCKEGGGVSVLKGGLGMDMNVTGNSVTISVPANRISSYHLWGLIPNNSTSISTFSCN